ncbi:MULTISPECIES: precorrin-2 dehydrogenase/sirohydrochlorin ferrochelatase family protein [unclassified Romboutsia]|uniref:precorrin-2 dehydrogenase/sirohydrochlorin ferrochelatase family protein n=1 Tax=unclassified Romboutsia TaxID=2626894 RepID=UPI0008231359|nr:MULTISPECIES: bifunctional precorrin-2 dehydrogenase/sirohydrochlorin ferrochelatase [unclassified Romboutsia]SCI43695.1 Precorrin-2 dehydrogenase [uncultured Clostridium sp.]
MFYPINLKIDKFKIIVIGGGEIAYRKCNNFIEFGNKIKVISPKFLEKFCTLEKEGKVELIRDVYKEEYIQDSSIVVAATNNKDVNYEIGKYCNEHNKLVNVVDNIELSNYIVPSYIKRGDLLLSVSTGGKSPSLSKKIKSELEEQYDDSYEDYIKLLGLVRNNIIKKYDDIYIRRKLIKNLVYLSFEELKVESKKYI